VDVPFKKKPDQPATPQGERRRIGMIVHDERGNASVDWRDAPDDHARPVLEILGDTSLSVQGEPPSYDPYARGRKPRETARPLKPGTRTDLRRLSEHIKLMRELEARKRRGEDPEE
jgi:hypothetical protein